MKTPISRGLLAAAVIAGGAAAGGTVHQQVRADAAELTAQQRTTRNETAPPAPSQAVPRSMQALVPVVNVPPTRLYSPIWIGRMRSSHGGLRAARGP